MRENDGRMRVVGLCRLLFGISGVLAGVHASLEKMQFFEERPVFRWGFGAWSQAYWKEQCFFRNDLFVRWRGWGGRVRVFAEGVLENARVLGTPVSGSATKRVSTYVGYRWLLKNAFC